MNLTSEDIIFLKVKEGDQLAFRQLYSKYFQPLFLFASKFVDEELAKDFVQDCFFDLWKNRNKIEISVSLSAYLFTIIKNKCFKHLKKEQKKLLHLNSIGFLLKEKELQFYINSEKSILEFGIKDRIEKVIGELPEKCSAVFKDSRFKGLANKEIAEKYSISVKAVEKQISKAIKLFKQEFNDIITLLLAIIIQNIF
jgi:RNA polymerase sigma-70 factor (ECF subfamily)